ncbi:MAG: TonB-dependent receptor plug domain-containing protein [Luteitalea sp.]|nr:TonB-dependent receptor plug domain-containing protein [Luteitalea sp.]
MTRQRIAGPVPLGLALLTLLPGLVYGQQTAAVVGTVTDATGGTMPGASITVTSRETGLTRSTVTNDQGSYAVASLPVGTYTVSAELDGFGTQVTEPLSLAVNRTVRVDFVLQVGDITDTVVVSGIPALLHTDDSQIGTLIENVQVVNLPLNGRNFTQLAVQVAGVAESPGNAAGSHLGGDRGSGLAFSVHGQRSNYNGYIIDGATVKEYQHESPALSPSIDAIEEFRVETSNYSAEFGIEAGAHVNIVTKSGTNDFRGSMHEFYRGHQLSARNFFASDKPDFQRHQFGGTLGGPIVRNQLFFFASYEGGRIGRGVTFNERVPDAEMRAGDFSDLLGQGLQIVDPLTGHPFPGNVIPGHRINPVARALLEEFVPLPNRPDEALNWQRNDTATIKTHQLLPRVDYNPSGTDQLFARYIVEDFHNLSAKTFPTDGFSQDGRGQNATVGWTRTLGGHLLNELRFSYNRFVQDELVSRAFERDVVSELALEGLCTEDPACWGLPQMSATGFASFGEHGQGQVVSGPRGWVNQIYELSDSMSYVRGSHHLKFGARVQRLFDDFPEAIFPRGVFTFDGRFTHPSGQPNIETSMADFLLGIPRTSQRSIDIFAPDFRSWALFPWIQDDWRISGSLTLNLGVRYEFHQRPASKTNTISTVDFSGEQATLVPATEHEQFGYPRALVEEDWNNVAPRIGLAWNPTRRLVIRSGYGVFYQKESANTWIDIAINPPFVRQTLRILEPDDVPGFELRRAFADVEDIPLLVFAIDRQWRDSYVQQWHLTTEFQLAPNLVLQAAYVGNKGTDMARAYDINQAAPGPGSVQSRRPFANFGTINMLDTGGRASYHGLELQAEQRYSNGLAFLTAYTFARCLDDTPGTFIAEAGAGFQHARDLRSDYGPCNQDVRHRFTGSLVYELPFGPGQAFGSGATGLLGHLIGGWRVASIATLRSGYPFTVFALGDPANVGSGRIRANLVGDPTIADRTLERFFNTDAFANPVGDFGDLGRNTMIGPSFKNVDLSIIKSVNLGATRQLELRAELFNLFNHTNFGIPGNVVDSATFGALTSASTARDIQLGLKFIF